MSHSFVRLSWAVLGLSLLAFAVYGSWVPFNFNFERDTVTLGSMFEQAISGSRSDWGVNVALFVPISFCLLCAMAPPGTSFVAKAMSILGVSLICAGSTVLVEFGQNWLPGRVASLSDVIAQLIGAAAGMVGWFLGGRTAYLWLASYLEDRRFESQLQRILEGYIVVLTLFSVMPLDVTVRPTEIYHKYKAGRVLLVPTLSDRRTLYEEFYEMGANACLCVPVGAYAVIRGGQRATVKSMTKSLTIGFGIVLGIELAQLFVASRVTDVRDLITGSLGVTAGIALTRRWQRLPSAREATTMGFRWKWFWIAIAYAVFVALDYWVPYDFTDDVQLIEKRMDSFFSAPFRAAIGGNYFIGLSALLRKGAFFLPFGVFAVLATRAMNGLNRRMATIALMFLVGCLAMGLELVRILLPSHSATIGIVILRFTSACVSLLIARRLFHVGRS